MLEQVDTALEKGIAEHTNAAQQRFEAGHSQLAHTLKVWWHLFPNQYYSSHVIPLAKESCCAIYRRPLLLHRQLLKP